MSKPYPLATTTWDQKEIDAIQSVIASGMYSMGPRVAQFEREFATYVGSKYCVMCNSGSSANLLMVAGLRFRKNKPLLPGDEVIVPAVSWSTTYHPLQQYGLKLKFVDVDRETLNYDLDALQAAVSGSTRCIMVVNLLGNPNDFDRISRIVASRDIVVIEDNCESLGARFGGRQAGTFGAMGSYSAFFSHHISTMEGGMVVTEDEELYHIMLSVRAHGWTRNLPKQNRVTGMKSDDAFVESFKFVLPGYNLRPLEMSGAIGTEQLKKLPAMVEDRRRNARKFLAVLADYPQLRTQKEIGESSWFGFSMIVQPNAPFTRADVVRVFTEHGIDARPIVAGNFAKNEVLRWFDYSVHGALTNADELDTHGLFIGNHHYPLDEEFETLRATLDDLVHPNPR
jgi:CDP-4-dehydro-6-deoxyglucose reductase, E1